MSKEKIEILNISCPNCDEENTIKLSSEIKCKHCEEPLTKTKYEKLKKPFLGTVTAMIIGSVGGHQIVEYFDVDRYPMSVEHSILENCISSYKEPLRISRIRHKKKYVFVHFLRLLRSMIMMNSKRIKMNF